ncbi:MAG: hypothetical protein ACOYN0_18465 [Phycisphaerales bacterium]
MSRFIFAMLAGLVVLFVAAAIWDLRQQPAETGYGRAAWALVGAPFLAGVFAVNGVTAFRRPRCFDPRTGARTACVVLGFIAALCAIGVGTLIVALEPDRVPEWCAFSLGGFASVAVPTLLLRRVKAGACIRCAYDLRATLSSVCPECGGRETA